jgi:hypothetical protein
VRVVTIVRRLLLVFLAVLPLAALGAPAALGQPAPAGDAASKPAVADTHAIGPSFVVPEGQEELLSQMFALGETLPGDCRFDAGQAKGPTISATYRCANGEVVFELHHPNDAATVARTERFGILLHSGSPPPGLVDALAARIRSRESSFEWKTIGAPVQQTHSTLISMAAVALLGLACCHGFSGARWQLVPAQRPGETLHKTLQAAFGIGTGIGIDALLPT